MYITVNVYHVGLLGEKLGSPNFGVNLVFPYNLRAFLMVENHSISNPLRELYYLLCTLCYFYKKKKQFLRKKCNTTVQVNCIIFIFFKKYIILYYFIEWWLEPFLLYMG